MAERQFRDLMIAAKKLILQGEKCLKDAAEHIAKASEQGASQRDIAQEIGKSPAWVCRLLAWRAAGYADETPFGPESKAKRERARVQAPEQAEDDQDDDEEADQGEAVEELDMADDEDEADEADDDDDEDEEERARRSAEKASAAASGRSESQSDQLSIQTKRDLLVKALGMLGSDHDGERANAALVVERLRAEIGMPWEELIVDDLEHLAAVARATGAPFKTYQ
jgi:hypothetical protein